MTEKQDWLNEYKTYPDTVPGGFIGMHESRVLPLAYEIPLKSKVLDIGANSGEFMKLLKEKRECDVSGVDVSDVAIAKAKEKGIEIVNCDAASLPFADATFDVVVLMEVLSHLIDPDLVLKEAKRVLKPSGILMGSVPHANLERFLWDDDRKHRRYYQEQELREAILKEFPNCYIRTLTGAQFALSFHQSFLADKSAEMLFKCGGANTPDWEKGEVNEHVNFPDIMPDGIENYPSIQSRVNPIFFEVPDNSKVLDIGCNSGEFMRLLRDKKGCKVSGAEISVSMIDICKAKGLNVVLCDADKLPFPDESFDVVILMEVLEHFHEPVPYLQEIRRVLKKDGILLGSCPHADLERYIQHDDRPHHQFYTEESIGKDFEKAGFEQFHIRVLKGSKYQMSFAGSYLAETDCGILFKVGGKTCEDWDQQMRDVKPLRVWFGPTQLAGTVYYRMLGFAEKMDKLGLIQAGYEHAPWNQIDDRTSGWQKRIRNKVVLNQLEAILRVGDLSVWQITINRDVLAFLRCAKDLSNNQWFQATGTRKAFITEIDDNIFDIPSGNVASHPYQPNSEAEWIGQKQIELSDALICSTQFLLDKMKVMFPEKPAYLVPNSIDFDVWDTVAPLPDFPKKEDGCLRIGYTGCSNHRKDLELIKEPLSAILKEFPHVRFLMTPQPDQDGFFTGWEGIPNMGMVSKWVYIDQYPAFLKSWDLDIGIAPLKDNDFNRAKSNLRWLEYSAIHIPTVASRVYPFKNSVRAGQDGLICNTSQQWYDALKMLILDAQKRKDIGEAAYRRVKTDFNLETVSRRYAEILKDIACNVQTWKVKSPDSSTILLKRDGRQQLLTSV